MDQVNHRINRMVNRPYGWVIAFLFVLTSCSTGSIYQESISVPTEGWEIDSTAQFQVEIVDASVPYDIEILTRNTSTYGYQNLWLFIDEQLPDGSNKRDTMEIYLADNRGRWLGSGMGSLYQLSTPFKQEYYFPGEGNYTFTIVQGMRQESLKGISDVGLRVKFAEKRAEKRED